jgi:MerR family transcriptional regulator/heat shock protein HspR
MDAQIAAVRQELRGGELVPLKYTRAIVPSRDVPPAPVPPAPTGPRRIRIDRGGNRGA